MKYCVIGEKLAHSMSPQIHGAYFDYYGMDSTYEIRQIPMEEMTGDCKDILSSYDGFNVTVPYKEKAMKYLSSVSDEARAIGAVNTVVNKGGNLCGYNTDPYGFESLVSLNGIEIEGKSFVILGSGGASKSAGYILKKRGAKSVLVATRDESKCADGGYITYGKLADYKGDVLINATPVGMYPNTDASPVDGNIVANYDAVVDIVYNPVYTNLLDMAVKAGKKAVGGLYMLVAQAMKSQEIWTANAPDKKLAANIYNSLMKEYFLDNGGNIYLTGIMSCGKSVKGKRAAKKLGWEFVDSDDYVKKISGKSIAELFAQGEKTFRDWESEAIYRLSRRKNLVVATGGGAVLRDANVCAMRLSGITVLIERNIEDILKDVRTDTRPLLKDGADKLRRIYDERKDRYYSTCDAVVKSCEYDINKTVEDIIKAAR